MLIWFFGGLLVLFVVLGGYAWVEARSVRHRRVELFFDTLPEPFDGYSVLYISDPHFQRHDGRKARLLAHLSADTPDLCVITGDLIEKDDAIHACQQGLASLQARDGVFYVPGNHDYFRYSVLDVLRDQSFTSRPNDIDKLFRVLGRAGLRLLRNQSVPLERGGTVLWLAGVDDATTGRHDLKSTFAGVPAGAFLILLTHHPDVLQGASLPGEHLVLAGHTHGGQVVLPFWGPLKNHSRLKPGFVSGKLQLPHGILLVSNGLGMNQYLPFRFRCRPEALTVRLRKRRGGASRAGTPALASLTWPEAS